MKFEKHFTNVSLAIFGIILLTGTTAMARTNNINEFDIKSKIFLDGKLISSPRIITRKNQPASITANNKDGSQSLQIKLIANEISLPQAKHAIKINYDIQNKNGNEEVHFKPQIVIALGQEGMVKFTSNSNHRYEIQVRVDNSN